MTQDNEMPNHIWIKGRHYVSRDLCITREDLERMCLNEHVFDPNDEHRPHKHAGWNACIDKLLEKINP